MADKEDILNRLHEGVVEREKEKVEEAANEALDEGVAPIDAIMDGLVSGMSEVGEMYDEGDVFVPEILISSEALYAGLDILKPHISEEELEMEGKIILGVVEGDIHDIGKNLVKLMLDVQGLNVVDLGKDVEREKFVKKFKEEDADIIGLSAMMTSTMGCIQDISEMADEEEEDIKIIAGGAPITAESAKEDLNADAYAPNATQAPEVVKKLINQ
ncbi:MAG: Trimethylamine corrinoid protein MtbC1 [Candidatus Methanohalarchaeum thermophilum]|uniref:Trimethylamine corrinoid protein MtbC1 n=1 Tax=Methanohalarchaeum thermophilum TaxID=1903181 RepID=A0A1Q6DUX1_METT1|nr:MAG: Trimethylamine corrinoid protein MtbC1 [Candidatus Methanohalarchaeum thermophilum]